MKRYLANLVGDDLFETPDQNVTMSKTLVGELEDMQNRIGGSSEYPEGIYDIYEVTFKKIKRVKATRDVVSIKVI